MRHHLYLSLAIGLVIACSGSAPPVESSVSVDPEPVEVIETESIPDAGTEKNGEETMDEDTEPSAAVSVSEPETVKEPSIAEAEAEEATAPSSDLQDYLGASTGYTPEYRTVKDNMDKFKQCYLDAMRVNPDLSGTIKIKFTVLKNGKVKTAKAVINELNDDVAACVIREMKKIKFPKRTDKRTIEYPFKFIPAPS